MKTFKIILIVIIAIILTGILALRIKKVNNDKSVVHLFDKEGARKQGFLSAEYLPSKKEIKINDTISFRLGTVWIHDAIKLKHRLYIFSEYFEKSSNNGKKLMYSSNGNSNELGLVLASDKYDSTFREISISKGQTLKIDSYSFDDEIIDNHNKVYDIDEYTEIDTLKLYIKRIRFHAFETNSGEIISDYNLNTVTLDKEPIDSILYYKIK